MTLSFSLLTASVADAVSGISLAAIIKWYGILCLVSLPVSLAALVFIYKKRPNIVSAFDSAIDKMVDSGTKDNGTAEETEIKEDSTAPKTISVEEDNEEAGIPNMILQIGDRYQCYLSKKNRNDILGGDFTWGTDNPFVGDIDESRGIFEAKKVGKTYIECGAKQIRIYYAEIKPNRTDWFGCLPVSDILDRVCLANIKVRELTRRISDINEAKNTITYDWDGMRLSYQMNRKDEAVRALFRIPNDENLITEAKEGIAEYMEPLKLEDETQDRFYFYHKCGLDEDYPESVDFIAFLRKSGKGDWYFGIGECWRVGATDNEIKENTEMVERSFKDLLDRQDIPTLVGTKLKNDSEPRTENKTESGARKADSGQNGKTEPEMSRTGQKKQTETAETEKTETPEKDDRTELERPHAQLDDTTDVPETNPIDDDEDYSDEENRVEIQSESDDPFADFSEAGEQEYGHEPASDINHSEL